MALAAAPDITGFRALSPLGYGPTSTIYSAQGDALGRWVALTVYSTALSNERAQRRFDRAFEVARRLGTHPHVVTMIESGLTFERQPYVVTELYERGTLQSRVGGRQPLSVDEALHIGVLLAGALETAHRADVIHGGIHPARVLLSDDGEPALADLGLVPLVDRGGLAALVSPISFHAAPEVLEAGELSPATDVYALASTLYAALAGRGPYQRDAEDTTAGLLVRILQHDVPPMGRSDVPGSLEKALRGALRCDPASRPGRVLAFARELQACQKELGLPVTDPVVLDVAASIRLAGSAAASEPRLSMAPVVEPAPPSSSPPQRVFVPAPDEIPDPAVSAPTPIVPASAVPPSQLEGAGSGAAAAAAASSVFPAAADLPAADATASGLLSPPVAAPLPPPPPLPLSAPIPDPPAGVSPWGRSGEPSPADAPPASGDGWASPVPESPWDRRVEPEPAEAEPWNRSGTPETTSPWDARAAAPEAGDDPWNRSLTPEPDASPSPWEARAASTPTEASPWDAPAAAEPDSPWNRNGETPPAADDTPSNRGGESPVADDEFWSRKGQAEPAAPDSLWNRDDAPPTVDYTPWAGKSQAEPAGQDTTSNRDGDSAAALKDAPWSHEALSALGPPPDDPAAIWTPGPLPTGATPKVPDNVADAPSSDANVAPGASVWGSNGASDAADPSAWSPTGGSEPDSAPDAEPEAPPWAAGGSAARVGDSAWGPVRGPESSSTLDLGSSDAAPPLPSRRTPPAPTPPAPGESPWPALAGRADPPADRPDDPPFGAPLLPGPGDDLPPFGQPGSRSGAGTPQLPGQSDDLSPFGAPPPPLSGDDLPPFGQPQAGHPESRLGGRQNGQAEDRSGFGAPQLPGPDDDLPPFGQPQAGHPDSRLGGPQNGRTESRSGFGGPQNGQAHGGADLPDLHAGQPQGHAGFGSPQNDQAPGRSGLAGPQNGRGQGLAGFAGPQNDQAPGRSGLAGPQNGRGQGPAGFGGAQNDPAPGLAGSGGRRNGQAADIAALQAEGLSGFGGTPPPGAGADQDGPSPFSGVQALDLRPRVAPEAQFHPGLRIDRPTTDLETPAATPGPDDEADGAPPMGTAARALPVIVLVALVIVLGAGLAWAVTTHDPSERDRAASVDGVDPSNDPPSSDDVVHVDVTAVENPSGVQLDWDGGADGEQVVLVLSDTEEPRLPEASTGTALLVPGNSLTAGTGYCFVVTTTSGPPPTPALIASDLPEDALAPAGCIRGASPSSVRR